MSEDLTYNELKEKLTAEREKSLIASNLIDNFISNVLHEIRTPMNAILGFSELLREMPMADQSSVFEYSRIIQEKGSEVVDLFDDLIKLSQIDAGIYKPKYQNFAFNSVISHYEENYKPGKKKDKFILFDLKNKLRNEIIYSDPYIIRRLISQMIENALRFTHKGYIQFSSSINEKNHLTISVENSGTGFPANVNGDHKNGYDKKLLIGGTGIGLAIVKKLVQVLSGDFRFKYVGDDTARLEVEIPLLDRFHEKNNHNGTLNSKIDWADKQILVAVDRDRNFRYIFDYLQQTRIKIDRVNTTNEAIRYCQSPKAREVSLILMDVHDSLGPDFQATREIKKALNHVPIITHTASYDPMCYRKIKEAGSDGFIFSPLTPKKLITKLSSFII